VKNTRLIFILLTPAIFWAAVRAADVAPVEKLPELRGVLAEGAGKRFGLFIPDSGQTAWAAVGQTVGGWKLKEYRAVDDTLVLVKDGREEVLHLSESVVGVYHKGGTADAQALLKTMKFGERMAKELAKNRERMLRRLLKMSGIENPTPEQLAAFQQKIAGIFDPAQLEARMAEAMGVVYTQEELKAQADFYGSDDGQAVLDKWGLGAGFPPGQEPAAIKEFYATPTGVSVKAKQAALNTEIQKTVGPWMGGVMKKVETAANEFAKSQGSDPQQAVSIAPEVRVTAP